MVDHRVLGYADCKENLIDGMMIDSDFHRQGYGTMLLKYCEERLFGRFTELVVESFANNDQANNFYRKNGWKEDGQFLDKKRTGLRKITYKKRGP